MKIFVVGITGATGIRLARFLKGRGDQVDGLYRRRVQGEALGAIGVAGKLGDLAQMDVNELTDYFRGSDVIVFAAGAGDADSNAMIDAIDGDGVAKAAAARSPGRSQALHSRLSIPGSRAKCEPG